MPARPCRDRPPPRATPSRPRVAVPGPGRADAVRRAGRAVPAGHAPAPADRFRTDPGRARLRPSSAPIAPCAVAPSARSRPVRGRVRVSARARAARAVVAGVGRCGELAGVGRHAGVRSRVTFRVERVHGPRAGARTRAGRDGEPGVQRPPRAASASAARGVSARCRRPGAGPAGGRREGPAADWRRLCPVWHTVPVARLSADAVRLPPGGLEASPRYSSLLVRSGSTGIFREAREGLLTRHPVGFFPRFLPRGTSPATEKYEREHDTPDRVGRGAGWNHGAAGFQSVTRDRTTK